jgi:hypothetical protein
VARQAKIYCTIGYERGNKPGCGYVARFVRKSDGVQVGAATWNRKERRFENARGIGGTHLDLAQVATIEARVPSLRSDGLIWYSDEDER